MSTFVTVYNDAKSFMDAAGSWLQEREAEANIILAHSQDLLNGGTSSDNASSPDVDTHIEPELWLCSWSRDTQSTGAARSTKLDFVLTFTASHMGQEPIFLLSLQARQDLTANFIQARIPALVKKLHELVPPSKVFSVFGPRSLVQEFVAEWERETGMVPNIAAPRYQAKMLCCTKESFEETAQVVTSDVEGSTQMRLAIEKDRESVAELCRLLSLTTPPYELDITRAQHQADHLIKHRQAWICEVFSVDQETTKSAPEGSIIATICAVSRTTEKVAAITKVFTRPENRRKGYAQRLMRHVVNHYLSEGRKELILYVGNDLEDARRVYERVGFKPLDSNLPTDWLEIGFDEATQGYW